MRGMSGGYCGSQAPVPPNDPWRQLIVVRPAASFSQPTSHSTVIIVTAEVPAYVDLPTARAASSAGARMWLRGIGVRQVRLITGLVMFAYIFSHFFNHALGNISYETMEAWLSWHVWWWRTPVVNYTLYTAAVIHFSLGLWALYQRRHF